MSVFSIYVRIRRDKEWKKGVIIFFINIEAGNLYVSEILSEKCYRIWEERKEWGWIEELDWV